MSLTEAPQHSPIRLTLAWGVHLFTASGAVFGTLAILAILAGDFARAGLLMLLTLFIDAVDGTLARAVRVGEVLPDVNGRRLDDMVDFLNFVVVPVVFMVAAGNILYWWLAAFPVLASAYGFSQEAAKTEDDFFLGWPSYWNVLALYLWLLELSPVSGSVWLVGCAIAVFIPIKYIYPSKLRVLRRTTNAAGMLWGLVLMLAILFPESSSRFRLVEISLGYPIFYVGLSLWLQRDSFRW
jgi:phosphatidylcholine synthase